MILGALLLVTFCTPIMGKKVLNPLEQLNLENDDAEFERIKSAVLDLTSDNAKHIQEQPIVFYKLTRNLRSNLAQHVKMILNKSDTQISADDLSKLAENVMQMKSLENEFIKFMMTGSNNARMN